MHKNSKV